MNQPERDALRDLRTIPGVGAKIARDLLFLGVRSVSDLSRHDPEQLYDDLCRKTGVRIDPCVLYVFRCAVYYASTENPDPDLLKWWKWKGNDVPSVS